MLRTLRNGEDLVFIAIWQGLSVYMCEMEIDNTVSYTRVLQMQNKTFHIKIYELKYLYQRQHIRFIYIYTYTEIYI